MPNNLLTVASSAAPLSSDLTVQYCNDWLALTFNWSIFPLRMSNKLSSTSTSHRTRGTKNGPERVWTDVILAIKPMYSALIQTREKNHEFREYKLRPDVMRLWLYESAPTCAITYAFPSRHQRYLQPRTYTICRHVVETISPKTPGDIRDSSGTGNDAFDAGEGSRYAYPIRALYRLNEPLKRQQLQNAYGMKSPRGFCYASRQMTENLPLAQMERVY